MGILISQGKKATDTMKMQRALENNRLIVLSSKARALVRAWREGLWKWPHTEMCGLFLP